MNLNPEQFEEMLAAYALDALEAEERADAEAQLDAAPQYRTQLFAYEEALAGLAALTPLVAEPVGHRERMMAKLNAAPDPSRATEAAPATMLAAIPMPNPALPPSAAGAETDTTTMQAAIAMPNPALPPTSRKSPQPSMMQAAAGVPNPALPPTARKSPQPSMMQRIASWFSVAGHPSFAAAALSLVLAIGLIFWNLGLQADVTKYQQQATSVAAERDQLKGQMAQLQQQTDQLRGQLTQAQGDLTALKNNFDTAQSELNQLQSAADLLGQPSTVIKALPGNKNTAFSQLIANDQQSRAVLLAYNLNPAPKDKTYEFWFLDKSGTPIPAGLFNVNESGKGVLTVTMPSGVPISELAAGAVTLEPAGGVPKPTGNILIVGNF